MRVIKEKKIRQHNLINKEMKTIDGSTLQNNKFIIKFGDTLDIISSIGQKMVPSSQKQEESAQIYSRPKNINKQYLMEERIRQLGSKQNYKQALKDACKTNNICCKLLNGLTLRKMEKIYKRTLSHYQANPQRAQTMWFENQLRLFQWILVIESSIINIPLILFVNEECWSRIQGYFFPKATIILEFECRRLLSRAEAQFHIVWCEEEIVILEQILEDKSMFGKWSEVSRLLFELSGKRFYRSGKQCREQWYNHLDNSKKQYSLIKLSGLWEHDEDIIILREVLSRGHKWAQICKGFLPHRTEHMLKNRFKSLLVKFNKQSYKWNANERKAIKRTLSKLVHTKNEINPEEINNDKNKIQAIMSAEVEENHNQSQKSPSLIQNNLNANSLSINNELQMEKREQNQQNQQNGQYKMQHEVYPCHPMNSSRFNCYYNHAFNSALYQKTQAELLWAYTNDYLRCFSIGSWQPFGFMS